MLILGIETSCDETAAAVVRNGQEILSNVVFSQVKLHKPYGGVVPEIASRAHLEKIIPVVNEALKIAKMKAKNLDAIAVTVGPGLITSLMVGVNTAASLAFVWQKPIIGVNHIEGHIFSARIRNQESRIRNLKFPAICLTVSGGHTMLVLVKNWSKYQVLGETLDDACGEAFDKVAKLLNLGYPGGPIVEKMAESGNASAFSFPRPMLGQNNFNFSFSGLKTAVLYTVRKLKKLNKKIVQELCASFQQASFEVLIQKTIKAAQKYGSKTVILAGGVAANKTLQSLLKKALDKEGRDLLVTNFPTDNAAMIAAAAYPRAIKKDYANWHNLRVQPNLKI